MKKRVSTRTQIGKKLGRIVLTVVGVSVAAGLALVILVLTTKDGRTYVPARQAVETTEVVVQLNGHIIRARAWSLDCKVCHVGLPSCDACHEEASLVIPKKLTRAMPGGACGARAVPGFVPSSK